MGKVYNENGEKLSAQQILDELASKIGADETVLLGKSLVVYDGIKRDDMRVAHAILDVYSRVDGQTEHGMRIRKLMDNLMTKYQKSITVPDQSVYHMFICSIIKSAGLNGKDC